MRIRKIKFRDEVLLGSLELNFLKDSNNKPYENVILVGENGVGKTTILNIIKEFVGGPARCYFYDFVEYEIADNVYRFERNGNRDYNQFDFHDLNNNKIYSLGGLGNEDYPEEGNPYRQNTISSFSVNDYAKNKTHDFSEVIERLKNLQEEDCINYVYESIKQPDTVKSWSDFFLTSKMNTFARAFNSFFENMRYFGLGFNKDKKKVIGFTKNGNEITTSSLSSGEKQIIERAVPFLEQMNDGKDNLCLIDEPEMSLHPKWQAKIYSFYKNLFVNNQGKQQNQIIMASHSSSLLKEALSHSEDTLVIRLKNVNGLIEGQRIEHPTYLEHITYAEVNYLVFGISSSEYHNQLYCEIQNRFNKLKVKTCDEFIVTCPYYNPTTHEKDSSYGTSNYQSLSTYIRNAIDHYDNGNDFTDEELEISIKLMQDILR